MNLNVWHESTAAWRRLRGQNPTLLDRLSTHKKISEKKMTIPVARAKSVW
jgi:hypothetical protein